MKVLVVDDSTTMRRIIIASLANMNLTEIVEAGNGQEAVDKVKTDDIGLILMDWNMPVMTGIEAVKMIRSLGMKMPIVMVTTEAEKERVLEALKSGANNYIIKPFRPEVVVTKLQETLSAAGVKL